MEKSIKIKSSLNRFCEIEGFLNSLFNEYNFTRKLYCKIYISVSEAVNNAIQHGNNNDIKKIVHLRFIENQKAFVFSIEDEGIGFDFLNLSDPTETKNIRNEYGRGIFFMKKYADEVLFKKNGTQIQLIFYKNSD